MCLASNGCCKWSNGKSFLYLWKRRAHFISYGNVDRLFTRCATWIIPLDVSRVVRFQSHRWLHDCLLISLAKSYSGGGIWHGIKGSRASPRGERLAGSLSAIKARAPVLGGNFGVWGGLFSSFDCAVKGYRQKEDPWNAIIAGFFTGGTLAARSGPKACFGGAVGCAILLGVFEGELHAPHWTVTLSLRAQLFNPFLLMNTGVGVLAGRMFAQPVPQLPLPEGAAAPPAPVAA